MIQGVKYFDVTQADIDQGSKLSLDDMFPSKNSDIFYGHPLGIALTEPDGDSILDTWEEDLELINQVILRTSVARYTFTWGLSEWVMAFERGEMVFPMQVKAHRDTNSQFWMAINKLILSPDQMELFQITEKEANGNPPYYADQRVSVEAITRPRKQKEEWARIDKLNASKKGRVAGTKERKNKDLFDKVVELIKADPSLLQGKTGATLESVGLKANQYNRTTLNQRLKDEGLK